MILGAAVYHLVYDVRLASWRPNVTPWDVVPFVVAGLLLAIFSKKRAARIAGIVVAIAVPLAEALAGWREYQDVVALRRALARGEAVRVEGTITAFIPGRSDGHPPESFQLGTRQYEYSPYLVRPGFRWVRGNGGPLRDGLRVRLYDVRGDIARLEVADEVQAPAT